MPNVRLGFTPAQIHDLRLGAVDLLQTVLNNGSFFDFFVLFWDWWIETHGLPIPGGRPLLPNVDPTVGEARRESRERLMSAVRYYASFPAAMDGAPPNGSIIRQRLCVLRSQIRQYRREEEAAQALTTLVQRMDLYVLSDWDQYLT